MTRLTQTRNTNAAALQAEIDRLTAVLAQMRWDRSVALAFAAPTPPKEIRDV